MTQQSVKTALLQTMSGIQGNAASAKVVFRADTHLEDDMRCRASVRQFQDIIVDEPPDLGGADSAPNPVELLLVALGSCQEIMYRAYASVMDIPLNNVQVQLRGYLDLHGLFALDPQIPAGYQKILFETDIDTPADTETVMKLVEMVESHCPVMDTFTRSIPVSGKIRINGESMQVATTG